MDNFNQLGIILKGFLPEQSRSLLKIQKESKEVTKSKYQTILFNIICNFSTFNKFSL